MELLRQASSVASLQFVLKLAYHPAFRPLDVPIAQLAKENTATAAESTSAIAELSAHLVGVLMEETKEKIQTGQDFAKTYETAVDVSASAMRSMSSIGGIVQVQSIVAHADLLLMNPIQEHDLRPMLSNVMHRRHLSLLLSGVLFRPCLVLSSLTFGRRRWTGAVSVQRS